MKSKLSLIFSEPVSEEAEAAVSEKLKAKMKTACEFVVQIVRAMEERYGAEAKEIARETFMKRAPRDESELGTPEEDLRKYIEDSERKCPGSHEWERVTDEPDRVAYRFTRCLWAEVFRELDATDIGRWLCESDDPTINAYNPHLRCRLTKTLMKGDPYCDHVFYVEGKG